MWTSLGQFLRLIRVPRTVLSGDADPLARADLWPDKGLV